MKRQIHNFTVIIEMDEDGRYIGSVPALHGCHTQGNTLDELLKNIKEAIELCLEMEKKDLEFAKKTEEAWKRIESGKGIKMDFDDFIAKMKKW